MQVDEKLISHAKYMFIKMYKNVICGLQPSNRSRKLNKTFAPVKIKYSRLTREAWQWHVERQGILVS